MKYMIGLDGGLTQTKAVLFDLKGAEINKVMVENDIIAGGECREIEMISFWEKAAAAVALLMGQGPAEPKDIMGIGVTGQGEGLWPVGANGKPVCNAILGIDHRAREEAEYVSKITPGMGKLIHRNIGCPVREGSTLMILKWMKKHRLDQYRKIKVVLLAKDWLRYCMTGRMVTDFSDGVASFLRFPSGRVPSQMLTVLELSDVVEKLPGVLNSTTIAGTLSPGAAEKMGLKAGIPVGVGAMDMVAASLGVGAITPGDVSVVLGSTNASMVVHDHEDCDPTRYWQHFVCHAKEELTLEIMSTLDITANIEWALEELTGTLDYLLADHLVENAEPGSGGVVFMPYLAASRERVTNVPEDATAAFFGMTEETNKRQMLRSVYEAVAYSLRDAMIDYRDVSRIMLSGGNAAEGVLPRIIADVTDATVAVSKGSEFAARGAVMAAGIGLGAYQDFDDAVKRCCKLEHIYQAKPRAVYQDGYQLYRNLRRSLNDFWDQRQVFIKKYQ
ncbi:MAG: FGGY family carbohydrate kinase [Eubacteriaceae bacterium]|jgi:sugar (pentulose or hexulose) kinase|nr:FGGY family carbohydrate kinase [Eubacteriaceae bacterium]